MAPSLESMDRRRELRQKPCKAVVQLDPCNGHEPIRCFVWDMSDKGARLKLSIETELPKIVYLIVENDRKPAVVVWRKADQVGLEFFPV